MTKRNDFLKYRVLAAKFNNQHVLGGLITEDALKASGLPTKNVCAVLSHDLVERLESALSMLDMNKRQFIEMAVISLLDDYDEIANEYDMYSCLGESQ